MNLVGYLNRNRSFPAPLISVGSGAEGFVAFYPSGDKVRLRGVESVQALEARESFVPAATVDGRIPDLAFGLSPQHVVAGPKRDVGRLLRTFVSQQGPILQDEGNDAIRAFLLAIGELTGPVNAKEFEDVMAGRSRLTFAVHGRQLRRKKRVAARLVVQVVRPGATKTLYRKNIPYGKSLSDMVVPAPSAEFLQRALF